MGAYVKARRGSRGYRKRGESEAAGGRWDGLEEEEEEEEDEEEEEWIVAGAMTGCDGIADGKGRGWMGVAPSGRAAKTLGDGCAAMQAADSGTGASNCSSGGRRVAECGSTVWRIPVNQDMLKGRQKHIF